MNREELLVVTGATGGLGKSVCHYFARLALQNAQFRPVFCCRNPEKGESLCEEIVRSGLPRERFSLLLADLSNKEGVRSLVAQLVALGAPVRYLVNNAASMFASYCQNEEGIEMNMAVNFFAPALLAEMMVPHLASGASVVNVLSVTRKGHAIGENFLTGDESRYSRLENYSQSKLALSIFTADMAARYPGLRINGVDPGVMNTAMLRMEKWYDSLADLLFRPFTRRPEDSLPAVIHACEVVDGTSGHVFTAHRHFAIERKIAENPFRQVIRDTIESNI